MKKILAMLFAAAAVLTASCSKYDDSDLRNKFTSLDSRLTILENQVKDINKDVVALQTLVSEGCVITKVEALADGSGYTFTLSDKNNTTLTIKNGSDGKNGTNGTNGKDGSTPQISAAKDGDVLYWTVDGEWLLVGGEKVPCTGAAPKVKVENGYWWVSVDGVNWDNIGIAVTSGGESGSGSCVFSGAAPGENTVTFTLASGVSFEVPLYKPFALVFSSESVEVEAGGKVEVPFTIDGKTAKTTVGLLSEGIFKVTVGESSIEITAPDSFESGSVVVYADNGAGDVSIRSVTVTLLKPVKLVFSDSFDWCVGTANAVGGTSGEKGWTALTDGTGGWTCEAVNEHYNCWARQGHIRFSRTNEGGILTSPALSVLKEKTDLVVTFNAARWTNSSTGATDALNYFTVSASGATVCATATGTYASSLTIQIGSKYDVVDWQSADGAKYTFYVKGATSETKITFASTGSDGSTSFTGTNRLVLDNVEVNKAD